MAPDDFSDGWNQAMGLLRSGMVGSVEASVSEGADEARRTHRYVDRTGEATRSIRGIVTSVRSDGAGGQIRCDVPYAAVLANGSKPHAIAAKDPERPMRFKVGNKWVSTYSVNHPGTKPDPFMSNAQGKAEVVLEAAVTSAIDKAFGSAGFD